MSSENPSPSANKMAAADPSHELDLVPLFSENGSIAEMEALAIEGILEGNDIPFSVSGSTTIPSLEFVIMVPASRIEDARRAVAEAQAAGPAAAEAGERESEAAGAVPE